MLKSLLPSSRKTALLTDQQIVFLAINKTGSTSIWTWMDEQRVKYLMNRYQEDEARKLQLIAELKDRGVPCFTVIRNPWDRAVSSWKWCMLKKGLASISFEEFLQIPFEQMTAQQRYHTSPQWQHVADAEGHLGHLAHVGRMEAIDQTRRWISQTLGLSAGPELPHLKKTDRENYMRYYTPQTVERVADVFRKDIELFGYRFGD